VEGRYGMTQGAIGLRIPSVSPDEQNAEARQMATALESDIFSRILDAMSFSNFRIDWRMFLYLRADFYKHPMFLDALPHVRPSFTIQQRPDVRNHLLRPSVKSTEEEAKKTDVKQDVVVRDVE